MRDLDSDPRFSKKEPPKTERIRSFGDISMLKGQTLVILLFDMLFAS